MLEISSNKFELHLCIFPKNIIFLKGFNSFDFLDLIFEENSLYQFFPISKARKSFLKKCLLLCCEDTLPFNSKISVLENLKLLGVFFSNNLEAAATFKHFNLSKEILNRVIADVSLQERFLLSMAQLFFKDAPIVSVFVEDLELSSSSKNALKSIFISKISNSNSIIFYMTRSGKSLEIEHETVLQKN